MSVVAAQGYVAGGAPCGIKPSGAPDVAVVATADRAPVAAAGVFTTNLVQAAPVQVSKQHLGDGRASGVVLNSGNANAATGEPGRRAARRMCELTATALGVAPDEVLVCSTGLIGIPLPMAPIESGIPAVARSVDASPRGGTAAATAILTTDTVRKEAVARVDASDAIVGGMAKGAAMLSPAMATMLAVVTTDAALEAPALQRALATAVHRTFDCLLVDGSRSTNDTVLVLANGRAGAVGEHAFTDALTAVCGSLAEQMARDAEGATKLARVVVRGGRSAADARLVARQIAGSQLVQCSLHGGDPYWGRVLSEAGVSGAVFDPERVDIAYNGITVCRDGVACDHDHERVLKEMQGREIEIVVDLHVAHGEAVVLTTDLSPAYIDENMRTS
jgi:glutamate N-acetyltransferase / amino-acid N-acetyltransferase